MSVWGIVPLHVLRYNSIFWNKCLKFYIYCFKTSSRSYSRLEMARAALAPLKLRLTEGLHGLVNRPNTLILSWVPLRPAHFFEALTRMLRRILFNNVSCRCRRPLVEFVSELGFFWALWGVMWVNKAWYSICYVLCVCFVCVGCLLCCELYALRCCGSGIICL